MKRLRTVLLAAAIVLVVLALITLLMWQVPLYPLPEHSTGEIAATVQSSAAYLVRANNASGRFDYLVDRRTGRDLSGGDYNMLRHAGTVYAMTQVQQRWPADSLMGAIRRATAFLRARAVHAVPDQPHLLAVWSEVKEYPPAKLRLAKLGGAGLALVAMSRQESLAPGTVPMDTLARLSDFIRFMQKEDGGFYSYYMPAKGGPTDEWVSLYYPGEAAYGQVLYYERSGDEEALRSAAQALAYLVWLREGEWFVEPDHWALLATAALAPHRDAITLPLPWRAYEQHAAQVCRSILFNSWRTHPDGDLNGGLMLDGAVTPTATRLEGLQAALEVLDEERTWLRARIRGAVRGGVDYLLRAPLKSGPLEGAVTHAIKPPPWYIFNDANSTGERWREVRIDYTQHTISALVARYDALRAEAESDTLAAHYR